MGTGCSGGGGSGTGRHTSRWYLGVPTRPPALGRATPAISRITAIDAARLVRCASPTLAGGERHGHRRHEELGRTASQGEGAGDMEATISVYSGDVDHDAVLFPGSPRTGKEAARAFYEILAANFREENEGVVHHYVADNALLIGQHMTGTVIGFPARPARKGAAAHLSHHARLRVHGGLVDRENRAAGCQNDICSRTTSRFAPGARAIRAAGPHPA